MHLAAQLHEVTVSLDMGLLLFLVAIDPDLTGVFLRRDQLCLLIDLVEELLALDVVLLLQ